MLQIKKNKPLFTLSTVSIGGPALYCVDVDRFEDLINAFQFKQDKNIKWLIIGNGSNLLFSDEGFNGLIVRNKIDFMSLEDNILTVGAGKSLFHLSRWVSKKELSGFEFASFPATVGGALVMNAAAFSQSISDFLIDVDIFDGNERKRVPKKDLKFSYRSSSLKNQVIVSARFKLKKDSRAYVKWNQNYKNRMRSQPDNFKNLGCIFKNTTISAGQLIDECGLKGYKIGGIQISKKHANFFVNSKNGTSKDMKDLIDYVKKTVYEKTNVLLEEEIERINV